MRSLCHRFDVGPILRQETYPVPTDCTADQLGATLATKGAHLVSPPALSLTLSIDQRKVCDCTHEFCLLADGHTEDTSRETCKQSGATPDRSNIRYVLVWSTRSFKINACFVNLWRTKPSLIAPKINISMSWVSWEDQTCVEIDRLFRAIGSRVRTVDMFQYFWGCLRLVFIMYGYRSFFHCFRFPWGPYGWESPSNCWTLLENVKFRYRVSNDNFKKVIINCFEEWRNAFEIRLLTWCVFLRSWKTTDSWFDHLS